VDCPYYVGAYILWIIFIVELKSCTFFNLYLFVHVLKVIFVLLFCEFGFQFGSKFVTFQGSEKLEYGLQKI